MGMRAAAPRIAALALMAPVILANLHQVQFEGSTGHTLAVANLLGQHADAVVRTYEMESGRPS